ncbi:fimbrial protein [Delftia tsuruhatensis]|uniref:fimbrial protein n=1 Tax=Delftia tsuruhatensis TaxID=180282 RepID=UPI001F289F3A|nr:fimbrial protein [Delftia tsuruhatensis]
MKYTHIHLWLAMAFFSFFTPSSHANYCTFFGSGITPPSANDAYYIYVGSPQNQMKDPNTVQIGRSMGSFRFEISAGISGNAGYYCDNPNDVYLKMHPSFVISEYRDSSGTYPTRIPGLGVLSMSIHGVSFPTQGLQPFKPSPIYAEIEFIKTGHIQSTDGIFTGPFAYELTQTTNQVLFEYRFQGGSTTPPITRPTCTLQPIAAVPLGTHPISRFTGVNTVTTPQDFTLDLACSGGTQGTSLSATMTLTDNTNTGNTTDALSLSTPQVSGVSVQILRNGIPLHLGPQNGPNSHYLGTISPPPGGGAFSYSIPLQARYKQTGSSVSGGGQANAEALVTINYQ